MADSAVKIIGRWAAGVLCALAVSLAYAQPPHGRSAGLSGRGPASHRAERAFVMTTDPYAHGGARMVPAPAVAPGVPFRPVSDEARTLAREGAAYLRAGSIRADIARYNEERAPNHPLPRPSTEQAPRPPQPPSVYRN